MNKHRGGDALAHLRRIVDSWPEAKAEYERLAPQYRALALTLNRPSRYSRLLRWLNGEPDAATLERRFAARPRHIKFARFVKCVTK